MRTDLVRLCSRCALRTADVEVCSRCGEAAVVRLEPGAPGQALAAIGRRTMREDIDRLALVDRLVELGWGVHRRMFLHRIAVWFGFAVASLPLTLLFATPPTLVPLYVSMAIGTVGVLVPDVYIWRTRRALAHERRRTRALPRVDVGGRALLAAPEATLVVGRVRPREACRSPLAGRACVAFRLVGQVDRFAVDDSGGEDFDLVQADGRVVVVRLQHAALALAVDEPTPRTLPPSAELAAFLAARQVPAAPPFSLAEAVLAEADRIAVAGRIETRAEPDGLRGTRFVDELRGRPEAPLVVTVRPPG
jgi:hypothetical protein